MTASRIPGITFWLGVVVLAMALVAVFAGAPVTTVWAQAEKPEKAEKVKDPVCNMMVEKKPQLSAQYNGKNYYFCMKADMAAFKKDPDKRSACQ